MHGEEVDLQPFSQLHFDASQYLATGESGLVVLTPGQFVLRAAGELESLDAVDDDDGVNALGYLEMGYYHRNTAGDVNTAYFSSSRPQTLTKKWNSWNLFFDQANWLRLSNTNSFNTLITLRVYNSVTSPSGEFLYELAPFQTLTVPLDELLVSGAVLDDNHGLVSIESPTAVIADMVRTKVDKVDGSQWDFVTLSPAL